MLAAARTGGTGRGEVVEEVAELVAAGRTDGRSGGDVKVEVAGGVFSPPEAPTKGAAAEEVGHDARGDRGEDA